MPSRPAHSGPTVTILTTLLLVIIALTGPTARAESIPFDDERWDLSRTVRSEHLGRPAVAGAALVESLEFRDGIIEVDVAVDGRRSYPGVIFRYQGQGEYERFYIRPHRAGLYPDALQYAPVWHGHACWQLCHGPGNTAAGVFPEGEWFTLRLEVAGRQMRVFVGEESEPALVVTDLWREPAAGSVGLMGPADGTAWFSNVRVVSDTVPEFDASPPPPVPEPGTLTSWQVSKLLPEGRVDRTSYPRFFTIFGAGWEQVTAEPGGLVNLSRLREQPAQQTSLVFARTTVYADGPERVQLSMGYSDDVHLFHNGRLLYAGRSGYKSRDPSFVGAIGLHDDVWLDLQPGLNEIFLMVEDSFGGWGFMARAEKDLPAPPVAAGACTESWRTDEVLLTPETVLHDPDRSVLYVSSFDVRFRPDAAPENWTGYISKLSLEGEIIEQRWVDGLNAPCGMVLREGHLFAVERGGLVEIDPDAAAVVARYPMENATFPNDVTLGGDGALYVSDTASWLPGNPAAIHRLQDDRLEPWLADPALSRVNGICADGDRLLAGNSDDGTLKAVDLSTQKVTDVACLGAGVVDGIRPAGDGDWLVSLWQGRLFRVTATGAVIELMDTLPAGMNTADFEYVRELRLLVVPTFLANRVVAYELEG